MRKVIILFSFLLFSSFLVNGQVNQDSVCFTTEEISNLYDNITELEVKDSLNSLLIDQYKIQVNNYKRLAFKDSVYSDLTDRESGLLKNEVGFYKDLYEKNKPKWYESKMLWYSFGVLTTILVFQSINK